MNKMWQMPKCVVGSEKNAVHAGCIVASLLQQLVKLAPNNNTLPYGYHWVQQVDLLEKFSRKAYPYWS